MIQNIAIIGGGPAGSTLGALLAREGYKVGIFHNDKRPDLIVGESLLPAVVPMLQDLGLEEKIKSFSTFKPGATIWLSPEEEPAFDFELGKSHLHYAYNVPRKEFDEALLEAAKNFGAQIFHIKAKLELGEEKKIQLNQETLEATDGFFYKAVDLIIDASGRNRLIPNLLKLDTAKGERKDLALFAHLKNVYISDPGNIHVDRFEQGWGWRIPLPDRVSVGIVIKPQHLKYLGDTKEEQYDNFLQSEPCLKSFTQNAKRLTSVVSYTNYQMKTQKYYGDGWVLAGDSAGFIDPVFSTGLYLAMQSSQRLFKAIKAGGSPTDFQKYQNEHQQEIDAWQKIIDYWYDGSLFTLYRVGQKYSDTLFGKFIDPHMTKHITKIFTGEAGNAAYSCKLLEFMTTYGIYREDPRELMIY